MITFSRLQTLFTSTSIHRLSALLPSGLERLTPMLSELGNEPFSRFQTLIRAGHFVVSAEITPPRHYTVDAMVATAAKLVPHVDILQVNDNALAQARLSSIVAAAIVQQTGVESVVQFTLRHRNRIALQSDLLGLAALGIQNVIVLGGYPCSIGSDPDAKDATDISTPNAIAALHRLTVEGQLFNGQRIAPPPRFYIGAVAIPSNAEASLEDVTRKIDAGAKYIQLQATFELNTIAQWMATVRSHGLHKRAHFIASMYPFSSFRSLLRLQQTPGLQIPQALIAQLTHSRRSQCWDFNLELAQGIRQIEGIAGLHLRSVQPKELIPQISQVLRSVPMHRS